MKISELAKQAGISAHTLRYYEKMGLLSPSARDDNNYRHYSADDLTTAKFIYRCKRSGFSLQETATLIQIRNDKRQHICAEAKNITNNKIVQLKQQIADMQRMVETLEELEQFCCGGDRSAEFCSIIAALEDRELHERH